MTPTPATLADIAPARSRLRDFPDWLGPMLVKDLRQSLRSRSFVVIFILLQGFICLSLLMSMAAGSRMSAGEGLFWPVVWVVLIVALPLRGTQAVAQERTASMLELIFQTRLNAFKIVAGKWAALSALTLLVAVCLTPCLMLRYFAIGTQVADEAILLALLTVVGLSINAVAVATSCFAERWARGLLALALLFFGLWSVGVAFAAFGVARSMGVGGSLVSALSSWEFWILLAMGPAAVVFFVLYGAGLISDPAENYSTSRRWFILLLLSLLGLMTWVLDVEDEVMFVLAIIIGAVALVDAATDPPRVLERVVRPFVRWRLLGRLISWFAAPGWHTAPLYALLLAAAAASFVLGWSGSFGPTWTEMFIVLLVAAGTMLWGTVVDRLIYWKETVSLPRIALIQVIAWITAGLLVAFEEEVLRGGYVFSMFFPHAMFIQLLDSEGSISSGTSIFGSFAPEIVMICLVHFAIASALLLRLARPVRMAWSRATVRVREANKQPEQSAAADEAAS